MNVLLGIAGAGLLVLSALVSIGRGMTGSKTPAAKVLLAVSLACLAGAFLL